ncbi:Nitrogen assimilation transcription factor [Apiospora marii]|uniref:Nitrogen assimilation transcription factor n=1 Tax=Apiospora marii TaxID=335849 RepID=A0ABR1RKC2_9PEZI
MASQSFRRLLPKVHATTDADQPEEPPKKSELVPHACARCRSHKTKCDGQRPSCGSCRARNAECIYDDDPNTTPAANLRRQYHTLAEKHQSFQELFDILRNWPEDEALVIFHRLRCSNSVQSTLHRVKEAQLLANTRMAGTEADDYPVPSCPKTCEE